MDLYIFIIGLCVCTLFLGLFLYVRVNKGGIYGLLTKTLASFSFVIFAILLSFGKTQINYYASLPICLIIIGLICGLIGDILLDLKVIYPFHENQYLKAGMIFFGLGHISYISSMILLCNSELDIFKNLLQLGIIFIGSIILCLIVWFVSVKILKLNFGNNTFIVNFYSFVLLLTTILSIYFCFVGISIPMFILAIGFILFLGSDLILSTQYFGGKQDNKSLIFTNHLLYYLAQITISMFIFFI